MYTLCLNRRFLLSVWKPNSRNSSFLAAQAIQEYVSVNEWQIAEIKKGLAEADAGDFATEEEMQQTIRRLTRRAR
jgi:predicted transcriptional regulator